MSPGQSINMKDNTRLYIMIRLQRMQMKESKLNPSTHVTLETLAEAVVSLQPLESSQDVVNLPNIDPADEES